MAEWSRFEDAITVLSPHAFPLDETALFYLRTRGIDEVMARQLLTRAFAQRIVDAAPLEIARPLIGELVAAKLEQISAGAQV